MKTVLTIINVVLIILFCLNLFFGFLLLGSSHNVPAATYWQIGIVGSVLGVLIATVSVLIQKTRKEL